MADEKLIFPIGFDLEEGVRQVQKDWKKHQPEIQKTIDRNPLKLKLELSAKGFNISELKKYIGLSKEIAKANREIAKTRSANALASQRESRQRVQEATELDQIKQKKAQAALTEERLTQAKQRSANATDRQNAAYKTQSGYLQRLFQRMVAYASVAQAFSFVRNIRDVTAEFELQRVALGSIIGDLNEANAMFEKIKAAAVKSPFQIKELVTYTKQLAAYKIESDELFETTQRLADISAGLGVPMDRLVLAYGQIRATGYLRASEVRQLTESGIPIVEELAKKMSDLRGETVSAAEVMGMISERAISFGMVKEVFDDMTSAGGMFYKMQEKQAETLAGQFSNLKDSISIMYEEIGKNETVSWLIKSWIDTVKILAQNWEKLASVLITVGSAYAVLRSSQYIINALTITTGRLAAAERMRNSAQKELFFAYRRNLGISKLAARWNLAVANAHLRAMAATTAHERAWNRLKYAIMSNPIGLILTAIATLVSVIAMANDELDDLSEELEKIGSEGTLQTEQSVRNFERLAKAVQDNAINTKEHRDALAEMKRTYGDLLPSQDSAIRNLVEEKDAYENVTTAIREKIKAQVYEQKRDKITSTYGEELASYEKDVRAWLSDAGLSAQEITLILDKLNSRIEEFKNRRFGYEKQNLFRSIIAETLGEVVDMNTTIDDVQSAMNRGLDTNFIASTDFVDYINLLIDYHEELKKIEDEYERAPDLTRKFRGKLEDINKYISDQLGSVDLSKFEGKQRQISVSIKKWTESIRKELSAVEINAGDAWFADGFINFDEIIKHIEAKNLPQLSNFVKEIRKQYDSLVPSGIDKLIQDKFQDIAKEMDVSIELFKNYFKTSDKGTKDWAKGLEDSIESLEVRLSELRKLQAETVKGYEQGKYYLKDYSKEIKETETIISGLQIMFEFFKDIFPSHTNKTRKSELSILQEELKLHEKIYAKYKEYSQYMSAEEAKKKVSEYFKDTIGDLKFAPSFDKDGYKNVLTQYQGEIKALLAKAKDETERGAIKKVLLDLGFKINDIDWDNEKDKLEKSLKDLSDKISRTKTAKEFFDKMLGLTGDKDLSATLTLSVYGTTGDDLKQRLIEQIQGAFAGRDLSNAINLNLKSFDLSALREIYNNLPDNFQEKQKAAMKQVLDMLEKGQNDLANNFAKLLMEYDEMEQKRVTITQKATQEIATLEQGLKAQIDSISQNEKISDKDSAIAQARARAEAVRKAITSREKLELSKLSPEYIRFFSSINAMAMETANSTRTQLRRALFDAFEQGGISAEELRKELKAIDTQFNKLNENASIFTSYIKGGMDGMLSKLRESADELDAIAARMMKLNSIDQMHEDDKNFVNKMLKVFGGDGQKSLSDLAQSFNGDMSKMGNAVQQVGGDMQSMFSNASGAIAIVDMIIKSVHQSIEAIQQVIDQINSMRSEDNQVGEWFKFVSDFDKYAMSGWENLKSGNVAGAMADTASSIISIFQNIQAKKIKRINKEIERQQELLEQLAYAYSNLEKAQSKVFGSDYISTYEQRLENLQAQQDAYLKQADLERSKGKKSDKDKIKEYEEQARETADAIKEMQSELSEYFLGTDLTSAARDFANAWIDAYKEFGSTTQAMKDKFADMIQNMVVESFAAKVIQSTLQPIFDEIDSMTKDGSLDISDAAKIADMTEVAVGNIDVGMTNLMNALSQAGISVRGMGSELTGISRDIATASEESILGLAAGINTQNFYISQVPPKLDVIIGLLQGGNLAQGSAITLQDLVTIQNQHLSHLPSIAQHTAETVAECKQIVAETRRTADALDRVIKPEGTKTTFKLNATLS